MFDWKTFRARLAEYPAGTPIPADIFDGCGAPDEIDVLSRRMQREGRLVPVDGHHFTISEEDRQTLIYPRASNLTRLIRQRIAALSKDQVFSMKTFSDLGQQRQVRAVLSRMVDEGLITRSKRGSFVLGRADNINETQSDSSRPRHVKSRARELIEQRIADYPKGRPFSRNLFQGLGTKCTVSNVLNSMLEHGKLQRISRGFYVVPDKNGNVEDIPFGMYPGAFPEIFERVNAQPKDKAFTADIFSDMGHPPHRVQDYLRRMVEMNIIVRVRHGWYAVPDTGSLDIPPLYAQVIRTAIETRLAEHPVDQPFSLKLFADLKVWPVYRVVKQMVQEGRLVQLTPRLYGISGGADWGTWTLLNNTRAAVEKRLAEQPVDQPFSLKLFADLRVGSVYQAVKRMVRDGRLVQLTPRIYGISGGADWERWTPPCDSESEVLNCIAALPRGEPFSVKSLQNILLSPKVTTAALISLARKQFIVRIGSGQYLAPDEGWADGQPPPVSASTLRAMKDHVVHNSRGEIFTTDYLERLHPEHSRYMIYRALNSLVEHGVVERIFPNHYVAPVLGEDGEVLRPTPEQVIMRLAGDDAAQVAGHGLEAVRYFGLIEGRAEQTIFFTSGRTRTIQWRGRMFRLIHTDQKRLTFLATPAGQAILAMRYLGRSFGTLEHITKIKHRLSQEDFSAFCEKEDEQPKWLKLLIERHRGGGMRRGSRHLLHAPDTIDLANL